MVRPKESKNFTNKIGNQSAKKDAEMSLMLDFMNNITHYSDKELMIQKSLEFFTILFSPAKLVFYEIEDKIMVYQFDFITIFDNLAPLFVV